MQFTTSVLVAGSKLYRCVHEAGHAQAALLVGARVPLLEMESALEGAAARARIAWNPLRPPTLRERRLVACAGHAVEHLLFDAGCVRDPEGRPFGEDAFRVHALANAAQDMTHFFEDARMGEWTGAMQRKFAGYSRTVAQPELRGRLQRIARLAQALEARGRLSHEDVRAILGPA